MKKLFSGILIGIVLSYSSSVAAEKLESLVGKQVQAEAQVQVGEETLNTNAIIIDGTSYGPIRAIGEAAGYNVGFKEGKIVLEKHLSVKNLSADELNNRIQRWTEDIAKFEYLINQDNILLNNQQDVGRSKESIQSEINEYKQYIADRKSRIEESQTQLDELNKQQ